jgi:hypothetical protein
MKKLFLAVATSGLFLSALFLSFSSDANATLHFLKKANAQGLTYKQYEIPCPGNDGYVLVCGPGPNTNCQNVGVCAGE